MKKFFKTYGKRVISFVLAAAMVVTSVTVTPSVKASAAADPNSKVDADYYFYTNDDTANYSASYDQAGNAVLYAQSKVKSGYTLSYQWYAYKGDNKVEQWVSKSEEINAETYSDAFNNYVSYKEYEAKKAQYKQKNPNASEADVNNNYYKEELSAETVAAIKNGVPQPFKEYDYSDYVYQKVGTTEADTKYYKLTLKDYYSGDQLQSDFISNTRTKIEGASSSFLKVNANTTYVAGDKDASGQDLKEYKNFSCVVTVNKDGQPVSGANFIYFYTVYGSIGYVNATSNETTKYADLKGSAQFTVNKVDYNLSRDTLFVSWYKNGTKIFDNKADGDKAAVPQDKANKYALAADHNTLTVSGIEKGDYGTYTVTYYVYNTAKDVDPNTHLPKADTSPEDTEQITFTLLPTSEFYAYDKSGNSFKNSKVSSAFGLKREVGQTVTFTVGTSKNVTKDNIKWYYADEKDTALYYNFTDKNIYVTQKANWTKAASWNAVAGFNPEILEGSNTSTQTAFYSTEYSLAYINKDNPSAFGNSSFYTYSDSKYWFDQRPDGNNQSPFYGSTGIPTVKFNYNEKAGKSGSVYAENNKDVLEYAIAATVNAVTANDDNKTISDDGKSFTLKKNDKAYETVYAFVTNPEDPKDIKVFKYALKNKREGADIIFNSPKDANNVNSYSAGQDENGASYKIYASYEAAPIYTTIGAPVTLSVDAYSTVDGKADKLKYSWEKLDKLASGSGIDTTYKAIMNQNVSGNEGSGNYHYSNARWVPVKDANGALVTTKDLSVNPADEYGFTEYRVTVTCDDAAGLERSVIFTIGDANKDKEDSTVTAYRLSPYENYAPVGGSVKFEALGVSSNGGDLTTWWTGPNNASLSGKTGNTLELTNIQNGEFGTYTFHVKDNNSRKTDTISFILSKDIPGLSINMLSKVKAFKGETVNLAPQVTTGSATNITYTWYKEISDDNYKMISSSTTPTLVISNVDEGDFGNYKLVVTDNEGFNNDYYVTLEKATVKQSKFISQRITPDELTRKPGENAAFGVAVSTNDGALITYQWKKGYGDNAPDIVGQTGSNLVLNNVRDVDAGNYSVDIYINGVLAKTYHFYLSVTEDAAPSTLTIKKGNGKTINLKVKYKQEIKLDAKATTTATGSVFYQWFYNGEPIVAQPGYKGASSAALTINKLNKKNAKNFVGEYYCDVSDSRETKTIYYEVYIDTQIRVRVTPRSASTVLGGKATFKADATAAKGYKLTYAWYKATDAHGVRYFDIYGNNYYYGRDDFFAKNTPLSTKKSLTVKADDLNAFDDYILVVKNDIDQEVTSVTLNQQKAGTVSIDANTDYTLPGSKIKLTGTFALPTSFAGLTGNKLTLEYEWYLYGDEDTTKMYKTVVTKKKVKVKNKKGKKVTKVKKVKTRKLLPATGTAVVKVGTKTKKFTAEVKVPEFVDEAGVYNKYDDTYRLSYRLKIKLRNADGSVVVGVVEQKKDTLYNSDEDIVNGQDNSAYDAIQIVTGDQFDSSKSVTLLNPIYYDLLKGDSYDVSNASIYQKTTTKKIKAKKGKKAKKKKVKKTAGFTVKSKGSKVQIKFNKNFNLGKGTVKSLDNVVYIVNGSGISKRYIDNDLKGKKITVKGGKVAIVADTPDDTFYYYYKNLTGVTVQKGDYTQLNLGSKKVKAMKPAKKKIASANKADLTITGKKKGSTKVTVKIGKKSYKLNVKVKAPKAKKAKKSTKKNKKNKKK
ncbi:MAG: immunoglobulin domain-containing protein [Lachnospiraceae bacterium]|nr:immunoglobulin domain-containing protein [Lachnospiraceae bacterium]